MLAFWIERTRSISGRIEWNNKWINNNDALITMSSHLYNQLKQRQYGCRRWKFTLSEIPYLWWLDGTVRRPSRAEVCGIVVSVTKKHQSPFYMSSSHGSCLYLEQNKKWQSCTVAPWFITTNPTFISLNTCSSNEQARKSNFTCRAAIHVFLFPICIVGRTR